MYVIPSTDTIYTKNARWGYISSKYVAFQKEHDCQNVNIQVYSQINPNSSFYLKIVIYLFFPVLYVLRFYFKIVLLN